MIGVLLSIVFAALVGLVAIMSSSNNGNFFINNGLMEASDQSVFLFKQEQPALVMKYFVNSRSSMADTSTDQAKKWARKLYTRTVTKSSLYHDNDIINCPSQLGFNKTDKGTTWTDCVKILRSDKTGQELANLIDMRPYFLPAAEPSQTSQPSQPSQASQPTKALQTSIVANQKDKLGALQQITISQNNDNNTNTSTNNEDVDIDAYLLRKFEDDTTHALAISATENKAKTDPAMQKLDEFEKNGWDFSTNADRRIFAMRQARLEGVARITRPVMHSLSEDFGWGYSVSGCVSWNARGFDELIGNNARSGWHVTTPYRPKVDEILKQTDLFPSHFYQTITDRKNSIELAAKNKFSQSQAKNEIKSKKNNGNKNKNKKKRKKKKKKKIKNVEILPEKEQKLFAMLKNHVGEKLYDDFIDEVEELVHDVPRREAKQIMGAVVNDFDTTLSRFTAYKYGKQSSDDSDSRSRSRGSRGRAHDRSDDSENDNDIKSESEAVDTDKKRMSLDSNKGNDNDNGNDNDKDHDNENANEANEQEIQILN